MQELQRYSGPAIALHWIVFVLIAAGWALGTYMSDLPFSPQKLKYVSWHKWLGVTVFLLAAVRLAWRVRHKPPPPLQSMPPWQRKAAVVAHWLLYALIIVIPISGWLFSSATGVPTVYLGVVQLPDLLTKNKATADLLHNVHWVLNWTLLVVVLGHTAAALKHHFIDRDAVLGRMLPFVRSRSE